MFDDFSLNPQLDIPIYQQLVDRISADIRTGRLPVGTQLPTVRKLADELNLAHGTIKRAYDELEKARMVEKMQGRGTFVAYQGENLESRKERAMAAIDRLFDQLEGLNFSLNEMGIFIRLKLQERAAQQANLKVAVVAAAPEVLAQLCDQLRQMGNLDLYSCLLEEVQTYPYKIEEDMDLVITPSTHGEAVENMMSRRHKIAKVALQPCNTCIARLAKLPEGTALGLLCQSEEFGALLTGTCGLFAPGADLAPPHLLCDGCAGYLGDKAAVLVPESYERYADEQTLQALEDFAVRGAVIPCGYRIDQGSLLYLEEKIQELLDKDRL